MFKDSDSIIFYGGGDWPKPKLIKPQVMVFSGGEVQVRVTEDMADCIMEARLRNANDIMELLSVFDACKRQGFGIERLIIPYVPYARQDRVCAEGEALGASVMATLINSLNAWDVTIYDPHSDVTPALINGCHVIHQSEFIEQIFQGFSGVIVAPDAGAEKKAAFSAKKLGCDLITARKNRNPQTGEITETAITGGSPEGRRCLIVDDICDGGRTFIELAKVLRAQGATKITLYVTHGIFSKGFDVFPGLIDEVYYTNSLAQNPHELSEFIHHKEIAYA